MNSFDRQQHMEFELVSFDESRSLINEILEYSPSENYELTPNEIFCVVEETGIILEGKQIPNWDDFESGAKEITIDDILKNAEIELETEEPLIIISDECFKDRKAY